jgi:twitching motility protein PilI
MKSSNITRTTQTQNNLGYGYLKFQLHQQTSDVIPINDIQEVLLAPIESVALMLNMTACILRLMNWRSRIVWVIDLPRMLNIEDFNNRLRQYNVIIVRKETVLLGLVVPARKGTTRFSADTMNILVHKYD